MSINIYKFLENDYSELYSLSTDINTLVFTAPHSVIVKSRVFIEQLSKEIAKLEKMEELNDLTLAQRLSALKSNHIIDEELDNYFYEIRKIGNQAAHQEVEDEIVLALKVHKNIYKVTGWFIETYIDYNFKTPVYKNPKPVTSTEDSNNSSILMKLMGKVEDLLNINKNKEDEVDKVENKELLKEYIENDNNQIEEEIAITRSSECLIDELSRLKESSREAVEGLNVFTDFKKYMHVDRNAQRELEQIILEAEKQDSSQLILVCGSVGDGKSHIISYFKNKYPDVIKKFTLHNDATESLEPNKTSMDTLNDLLENFTDEKINSSNQKIILAINLGTLNNFIDSEYGEKFTKLRQFVNDKKILERSIADNSFDSDNNIQFVNFSDYSLYTLKDGKVESDYIKSLIKKITDKSEMNIFYKSYQSNCIRCVNSDKCPIKANYELLGQEKTQDAIVDLLVQCIGM